MASLADLIIPGSDIKQERNRDQYGRTVTRYTAFTRRQDAPQYMENTWCAVVVNLPKTAWERDGMKFMVNTDPTGYQQGEILYFADRKLAHVAAIGAVSGRREKAAVSA